MPLVTDGREATIGDNREERNRNPAGMENAAHPFGCCKICRRVDHDEVSGGGGNKSCGRGNDYLHRMAEQTQGG